MIEATRALLRERLRQWMREHPDDKLDTLAKLVGCSRQYLWMLANGESMPGRVVARGLEDHLRLPVRAWDEDKQSVG